MKTVAILVSLVLLSGCQSGPEAMKKCATDRFSVDRETFLRRSGDAGMKAAIDQWEVSGAKSTGRSVNRFTLFVLIPKFNPRWDASDRLLPNQVSFYSKRLEKIPPEIAEDWSAIIEGDRIYAAASLAAENELFTGELFNEKAYKAIAIRLKGKPTTPPAVKTDSFTPEDSNSSYVTNMQTVIRTVLDKEEKLNIRDLNIAISADRMVALTGIAPNADSRKRAEEVVTAVQA
ncbi:MAG: hypothetical protein L0312_29175 [Acidobacteria bacterium]|nr:hypothetical protein [Acidobacteriota bacterium]